jgi:carbon-monoxide dehydrogenase small subunit
MKELKVKKIINVKINNDNYEIAVDPWRTLNELLRDQLNLTGTKLGCGTGDCGACTVLINGKSVNSCLTLAVEVDGKEITTIEGLADSEENLHPIQESFIEKGAVQCGYCTPGMIMTTKFLLDNNPSPTKEDIKKALDGNLCRCTGYYKIIEAIEDASKKIRKGE